MNNTDVKTRILGGQKEKVIAFFDKLALQQDRWVKRSSLYYRYLAKLVRILIPQAGSVLELGSGSGDLLKSLSPEVGMGVDVSPAMIDLAKKRHPDLKFICADAETVSIEDKFDTVLMSNTVGLLEDVYATLKNARKMLNGDGRIVIIYWNNLWEPILRFASLLHLRAPVPDENWLPLAEVENLLELTGFQVVRSNRRMLCPKFIPFLSWFLNRCLAPLPLIEKLCLIEYVVARPLVAKVDGAEDLSCSIIIPTKDERGNIGPCIERTKDMGKHTELIFVDGNSADGTVDEIKRVIKEHPDRDIKLIHQNDGVGKGDAVRKGFDAAKGDIYMILDSDLTMPPEDLPKYFEIIASGHAEFVNGCRLVYPMEKQAMRFLNKIANHIFGRLFSWLMEQRVRDTLCGTKVLSRVNYLKIAANRSYFGDFDPFGDFDLLFGAARLNLKIVDLPIRYRDRSYGDIKISRFKHGLLLLRMSVFGAMKLKFF